MVKRDLIRNIIVIVLVILGLVALRAFVFEPYQVETKDENRDISKGNIVLANKVEKIRRQDLVLYEVDGKDYVGRIVAIEDDSVVYMDDVLYLNHKIKEEEYLTKDKDRYLAKPSTGEYFTHDFTIQTLTHSDSETVPAGLYLVLNDDRTNMKDSREFGLIEKQQIKGVISFRLLPLQEFGFIKTR
ncbi:signal peptidase I [Streptococcus himalayensis]|uniref:Signal peptidase I n=1 Tax=Streptococcus himalayensis TaxID=1888195 RepID=A0A917A7S3_9STRE|nr:signal peptidase I [Streptococcus himalayensis]GGE32993.1 signal peptidase I [Streptococcus himalayensis]